MSNLIYICQDETCEFNLGGLELNKPVKCPYCKKTLVEKDAIKLTEEESYIVENYPYAIAYQFKLTLYEKDPFKRLSYLKDTFYNYLKYIGLMAATEFFNSPYTNRILVREFQDQLFRPTFGKWNKFTKKCLNTLNNKGHHYFMGELPDYFRKIEIGPDAKKYISKKEIVDEFGNSSYITEEKTGPHYMVDDFRNAIIGHGQTLTDDEAIEIWDKYYPVFLEFIREMRFVVDYPMYKRQGNKILKLMSADFSEVPSPNSNICDYQLWIENQDGKTLATLPFFVNLKDKKAELFIYEGTDGISIKYQSPKNITRNMEGDLANQLGTSLQNKAKERPFQPDQLKEYKLKEILEVENTYVLNQLIQEKKVLPNIYQHRADIESELNNWIGARMSIFFIAAEAGSGKTNLLVEMQRQYKKLKFKTLLLRASRFEKDTLEDELKYVLNLSTSCPLTDYKAISGRQSEPMFLLIDGLNESKDPNGLWKDIKSLVKKYPYGRLKVVVTCRVNSKDELRSYEFSEHEVSFLYNTKENHSDDLSSYVHWLTPLNMIELEGAWGQYQNSMTQSFKPGFSFDEIAYFDRNIYNTISNPLILRLFLKTYHEKPLPEEKGAQLNLWKDWNTSLSKEEQQLLTYLAAKAWETGANSFVSNDLTKDKHIGKLLDENTSNPLSKLEKEGWLSIYIHDGIEMIAFTVEACLHYIIAMTLVNNNHEFNVNHLHKIVTEKSSLRQGTIEAYFLFKILNDDIKLITEFIDDSHDAFKICLTPVYYYLKIFGVDKVIDELLKHTTINDIQFLTSLIEELNKAHQFHIMDEVFKRLKMLHVDIKNSAPDLYLKSLTFLPAGKQVGELKELSNNALPLITNKTKDFSFYISLIERNIVLGLYEYSINVANAILNKAPENIKHNQLVKVHELLGECYYQKGEYNLASKHWLNALNIIENENSISKTIEASEIYNSLGCLYLNAGEFEKAHNHLNKAIQISTSIYGKAHAVVLYHTANLSDYYRRTEQFIKAKSILNKVYNRAMKILPNIHEAWHQIHYTYGWYYISIEDYKTSLFHFKKALDVSNELRGEDIIQTAYDYSNIGVAYHHLEEFSSALSYYKKAQNVYDILNFSDRNINSNIASIYYSKGDWNNAEKIYKKSLKIYQDDPNVNSLLGEVYLKKKQYCEAKTQFEIAESILKQHEGGNKSLLGTVYSNKAKIAELSEKDYLTSIHYYEKALEVLSSIYDPNHRIIYFCLHEITRLNINAKRFNKAIEFLTRWVDNNPGIDNSTNSVILTETATIYEAKGDLRKAIYFFNESWILEPKGGVAWQIFYCYKSLNDSSQALEWLEKCALTREERIGLEDETTQKTYKELIEYAKKNDREDLVTKYSEKLEKTS